LHLGDRLFWHLPASDFRGRFEEWGGFIAGVIEAHQVTDLVVHGDRRPYHLVAAEATHARGARVLATDLGYLRPGWITLEQDGMTRQSRLPRDPNTIRALAREFPEPELEPRFATPFPLLAALDVAYNTAQLVGWPLYPRYQRHGLYHPFAEYAGWMWSAPRRLATRQAANATKARLAASPGSYFLFPLQLATDFQIRAHSDFLDVRDAVRLVLRSFAASGGREQLVVVGHPLDEGLINWRRLVGGDRVIFVEGGSPPALLNGAAGIVTINSTIGLEALRHGIPVKTLGDAVYDIAGLTDQRGLAAFWHAPKPPDPELLAAFLRVLVGATQIRGGYYDRAAQNAALPVFVERLEHGPCKLPPRSLISAQQQQ
jgi:capsular polysaccharide export protein